MLKMGSTRVIFVFAGRSPTGDQHGSKDLQLAWHSVVRRSLGDALPSRGAVRCDGARCYHNRSLCLKHQREAVNKRNDNGRPIPKTCEINHDAEAIIELVQKEAPQKNTTTSRALKVELVHSLLRLLQPVYAFTRVAKAVQQLRNGVRWFTWLGKP